MKGQATRTRKTPGQSCNIENIPADGVQGRLVRHSAEQSLVMWLSPQNGGGKTEGSIEIASDCSRD